MSEKQCPKCGKDFLVVKFNSRDALQCLTCYTMQDSADYENKCRIRQLTSQLSAAEAALAEAQRLADYWTDPRWGNIMVRMDVIGKQLKEALSASPAETEGRVEG